MSRYKGTKDKSMSKSDSTETPAFVMSDKQREVARWFVTAQKWCFAAGVVRSGKSWILSLMFIIWSQSRFKEPTDFIIAGNSVGSVRRNILPEMEGFAKKLGFSWRVNHQQSCLYCGRHRYHFFGSKDKDSPDAIKGMTAGGAYLDEMTLMSEDFISMVITRCSLKGVKIIGSTNPDYPDHFIKLDYIDRREELNGSYWEFGFKDNPVLDPQYVVDLKKTLTGADYERLVEGKWVANAGLVHPFYKISPEKPRGKFKTEIAVDYATSSIAAFLLIRRDRNDVSFVTNELYHDGGGEGSSRQLTDAELVGKLAQIALAGGESKRSVKVLPDPSAASFKRECRNAGWDISHVRNDIDEGIRVLNIALKRKLIIIDPRCKKLLRELGTYVWDEKACARGEDKPLKTKKHHGVDALRYYAMKHYRYLGQEGLLAKPEGW